jgi:hypothetical protein
MISRPVRPREVQRFLRGDLSGHLMAVMVGGGTAMETAGTSTNWIAGLSRLAVVLNGVIPILIWARHGWMKRKRDIFPHEIKGRSRIADNAGRDSRRSNRTRVTAAYTPSCRDGNGPPGRTPSCLPRDRGSWSEMPTQSSTFYVAFNTIILQRYPEHL